MSCPCYKFLIDNNLTVAEEQSACSSDVMTFCVVGLNVRVRCTLSNVLLALF